MLKFSCVLLGNKGTGKTSFVKRLKTGEFVDKHQATKKLKVYKLDYETKKGIVHFFVWDTINSDDLDYLHLNGAIIFLDMTSEHPHRDIVEMQNELWKRKFYLPIVICRNKVDLNTTIPMNRDVYYMKADDVEIYDISVKKTYNCEMPFLWFSRKLLNDPHIKFKRQIAVDPPYTPINQMEVALCILEIKAGPLPPEEDGW